MNTITVRMEHARALGYCAAGVRTWCAAHGIDYLHFAREGISCERVLATGDELGRRVAAEAARAAGQEPGLGAGP